jgi:hypothetical protein
MAKINTRSPYYISLTATNLTQVDFDIWIYTGEKITDQTTGSLFRLSASAVNEIVTVEIAELVSDYILSTFDGDYECTNVWVDYRSLNYIQGQPGTYTTFTTLGGFNGYGFFEDGANPQNNQSLLQSNTTILKLDDAPVNLPVDSSSTTSVSFYYKGEQLYTQAISSSLESVDQIKYITNTTNGADDFQQRVLLDGGIFEGSICLEEFNNDFSIFPVDTIYLDGSNGVTLIKVKNIEECKYQPYKITFINKFGALQDIWFFKSSRESLTTKAEKFKRNIVVNGSYDTSRHQQKVLTKNGNEKLSLNTGFYPESYNEIFKEMQLSEDCWIEINNQTLPLNVSSSSLEYKTSLNDKLINYTIDIEFAYDTINNIR